MRLKDYLKNLQQSFLDVKVPLSIDERDLYPVPRSSLRVITKLSSPSLARVTRQVLKAHIDQPIDEKILEIIPRPLKDNESNRMAYSYHYPLAFSFLWISYLRSK